MKTLVYLSSVAVASAQQLICDNSALSTRGFPENSTVQIYASNDLQTWRPRHEMAATNRMPFARSNEFFRARMKPFAPRIDFGCLTVQTGRLFHAFGTASELLVNVGGLTTTHQEMGLTNGRPGTVYCQWEYGYTLLPVGTNTLLFDFLDVNNNHVATNFTVVILPGAPLSIEQPLDNSMVIGNTTTIIGRAEATSGIVSIGTLTAPVHEDGRFYFVGFAVAETNAVRVEGPNRASVTVSFGKSHIPFSGNISGRTVSGTTDPANTLNIGGKIIRPSANGSWKLDLPMPPVKGMLPFSIENNNGESASGVITSQYDQSGYYITSHALSYHYTFENKNDPDTHRKSLVESMNSSGDVKASFEREFYPSRVSCPGLCKAEYSGEHMILWLDSEEGPCNYLESRRYFPEFGLINYADETSQMWFYHDDLQVQETSSCGLHIGGNGNRAFRLALKIDLSFQTRDGTAADEMTTGGPATAVKVGYVGGWPVDSSGTVYLNVIEGRNYNITPSLIPMNQGWFFYEFDWNEVPIATL